MTNVEHYRRIISQHFPGVVVRDDLGPTEELGLPVLDVFFVPDAAAAEFHRFSRSEFRRMLVQAGLDLVVVVAHTRSSTLQHYPEISPLGSEPDSRGEADPSATARPWAPTGASSLAVLERFRALCGAEQLADAWRGHGQIEPSIAPIVGVLTHSLNCGEVRALILRDLASSRHLWIRAVNRFEDRRPPTSTVGHRPRWVDARIPHPTSNTYSMAS